MAHFAEAIESEATPIRLFESRLQVKINSLAERVYGEPLFPNCCPPSKYARELFGIEYIYQQTGEFFNYEESCLETNLQSYYIHETHLLNCYKDNIPHNEVNLLMQG